jgi:hypothetical protein
MMVPEKHMASMRLASHLPTHLDQRVERLVGLLEPPPAGHRVQAVVEEVRALLCAFKTTEAQHVRVALADPSFAFTKAQERLGFLRRSFGETVRVAVVGLEHLLSSTELAELERVALVAEAAPMTTSDDLEVMRAGRAGSRRSAVA